MSITKGTPTLGRLLNASTEKALRNLNVALPGTVVSYNAATQTCSVRPGVHRATPSLEDNDEDVMEPLPTIQDVPVCWPQGRGFQVKSTLLPNDPVLLVCMDRNMDGWRSTGRPSAPEDARMHHWSSAVAIPGLLPDKSPFTPPTDSAALASRLDIFFRTIAALPDATSPATAVTAIQAVIVAARAVTGSTGPGNPGILSLASQILKLSS